MKCDLRLPEYVEFLTSLGWVDNWRLRRLTSRRNLVGIPIASINFQFFWRDWNAEEYAEIIRKCKLVSPNHELAYSSRDANIRKLQQRNPWIITLSGNVLPKRYQIEKLRSGQDALWEKLADLTVSDPVLLKQEDFFRTEAIPNSEGRHQFLPVTFKSLGNTYGIDVGASLDKIVYPISVGSV